MSLQRALRVTTMLASVFAAAPAFAYDLGEYGKIQGDFRLRHEFVDQEGIENNANASTARLRLGYLTPTYQGFTGYAEGEVIQNIGAERYNDGANGRDDYPTVNDPNDFALSQLYLNYAPTTAYSATVGRQYIVFDSHRFLGWSKFRQNDTVHDAARFTVKPTSAWTFDYVYSIAAHRGPGSRQPAGTYEGNFNLFHGDYQWSPDLKLSGYGYWLDFETYQRSNSSRTIGARADWRPKQGWESLGGIAPIVTVDMAQQSDIANNPTSYDEWYNWFEVGGSKDGYSLSAVYERLGGDGNQSVRTPLGTNHSFTGWVDRIDNAPADGLVDYMLWLKGPVDLPLDGKTNFEVQLHQFEADAGDSTYGQEIDLGLSYSPVENHTVTAQLGHYIADELLSDTTKVWLYYDWKF